MQKVYKERYVFLRLLRIVSRMSVLFYSVVLVMITAFCNGKCKLFSVFFLENVDNNNALPRHSRLYCVFIPESGIIRERQFSAVAESEVPKQMASVMQRCECPPSVISHQTWARGVQPALFGCHYIYLWYIIFITYAVCVSIFMFLIELTHPYTIANRNEIHFVDTLPFIIFLTPVSCDGTNCFWRQRLLMKAISPMTA